MGEKPSLSLEEVLDAFDLVCIIEYFLEALVRVEKNQCVLVTLCVGTFLY